MSDDVLRDALAAGLATLSRVVAVPSAPLGYGVDLSCASDLTPDMAEVDPMSPTGIGQSTFRRWDCQRGALPPDGRDARDYGRDIRGMLNRGTTDADLNATTSALGQEALKDDRISTIKVGATPSGNATRPKIEVAATITPADPTLEPFALVLAVDGPDVVIKAIGGAT